MNIKVKAGLEVIAMVVGATVVVAGVRFGLDLATTKFGIASVLNSISMALATIALGIVCSLLYDMRVNKLKYKAKLKEMVDRK